MKEKHVPQKMRTDIDGRVSVLWRILFIALPIVCFFVCVCLGRLYVPFGTVLQAFLSKLGLMAPVGLQAEKVIFSMRVPRLILAAVAGLGLSVSGSAFQNLFSNPLATPDTLGVASGASFGAVLALLFGFSMIGVQLLSLAFGLAAVLLTGLAGHGIRESRTTPILAGIMVGSLFTALVSLVKFTADTESQLPAITFWLMGSLESANTTTLLFGAPPILIGTAILFILRWRMNLLPLADDEAKASGVHLKALRITTEICATVITASAVSMCGAIGWVGLIVPHICRMAFGNNNVSLIPASVSIGAVFLMIVDTVARTVSPAEIPISILTAVIGAPFFMYLLRKSRGWRM